VRGLFDSSVERRNRRIRFLGLVEPFSGDVAALFFEHNKEINVKPYCFEFTEDVFCSRSFTKHALGYPPFSTGRNKHSVQMVIREKIINFDRAEGRLLSDLKTLWGESLVNFQHWFLLSMFPGMQGRVVDGSNWLMRKGGRPALYYPSLISLAVAQVVYFDDFLDLDQEADFTKNIVVPSFENVKKCFGLKPLIVKISRVNEFQSDPWWWCYSKEAKTILDARRNAAHRQVAGADDPLMHSP
jgi:hypothetical protein